MSDQLPSVAELIKDGHLALAILASDLEYFEGLTLQEKIKIHAVIKHTKPHPEYKDDHGWLVSYMKENIEATEEDEANAAIAKIAVARNADELAEDAQETVQTFVPPEQVPVVEEEYNDPPPPKAEDIEPFEFIDLEPEEEEEETEQVTPENATVVAEAPVETPVTTPAPALEDIAVTQDDGEIVITEVVSSEVARAVAENSCILQFAQSEPTFKKKVNAATVLSSAEDPGIANVDPQRLSVSKSLIETRELNELLMHRRRFNRALDAITLPGGLLTLKNGQYLLPLSMINQAKEMIDEYIKVRAELLQKFEQNYPAIIERARVKLAGLFDQADYPDFSLIRDSFSVTYRFISNKVPEELRKISDTIYEQESARVLKECAGAAVEIEQALRQGFSDIVEHFADRLGNDEKTGRPKQLHASVVDKVKDFINTFQHMDLTGDKKLGELVSQAREVLGKADADMLRSDSNFRDKMKEGFTAIKESASELIETRKRKVILE